MRDCFEQYLRGETYDHIRMDLLFNIYGIFAPFRSDDMAEKGAGTIAADRGWIRLPICGHWKTDTG